MRRANSANVRQMWPTFVSNGKVLPGMRSPDRTSNGSAGSCPTYLRQELHPEAPREEDPHFQGLPRRQAQAGHGGVGRSQGPFGVARRARSEEARNLLDPVIEGMMEAVHYYEGLVSEVRGDGIMALFGAPLAHEDHAVRACYAALRMQDAVQHYADEVQRSNGPLVQIRVGINSGEVVVRSMGSDLRMDYSAVGRTTHLAARMEQVAAPGTIRLTADSLRLAEGFVEVTPLGPVPVKGLANPVEAYALIGAGQVRTRLQAAVRRALTDCVGRDPELEQLRRLVQLAGEGRGQIAAIVGEAGVGKSRLAYELAHSHRLQGWLILGSACVSYGKATSYLPVIELLKSYFKIENRDDVREVRTKVTGRVLA